jgi:hypothetical protein
VALPVSPMALKPGRSKVVCSFYRQYDGYPSGHGDDLAEWLKDKNLVNGKSPDFRDGIDHNRAGQIAIELMHYLKSETSIEVIPTGSGREEFEYRVYFSDKFEIECKSSHSGKTHKESAEKFSGSDIEDLWCEND